MPSAQHRKFDQGFNQDEASFLLPEGYVYSSKNMLFDKLGVARKRGGVTGLGATTTYSGDLLGMLTKDDGSTQLYSAGSTDIFAINTATGAFTSMGISSGLTFQTAVNPNGGRPFQHFGFLLWPAYDNQGTIQMVDAVAGASGSVGKHAFTAPASVGVTAGDQQIVCGAADNPLTLLQVGQIIYIRNTSVYNYVGRVTKLVSTTAFEVYPTPVYGMPAGTVSQATTVNGWDLLTGGFGTSLNNNFVIGRVGMSFQGRVCLGNCARTLGALGRSEVFPRRFWFSSTLLEADTFGTASTFVQGAVFLTPDGYPALNYFDIPAQEAITAISPTGFGDAVIFSAFRTFRLTGNLSTQFGTGQSITWSVREIPNSVGCITERSMQRSPRGIIFAHDSGVYATDGSSMRPLMNGRVSSYWKALQSAGSFTIYGSGLLRGNHYYICGTSGGVLWGLLVNLDTLAWGPLFGKATTPASWIINSSVQDAANTFRTYGLKWFGQGAAVSMTGGQLVKVDEMFRPTSASRSDSDTTLVNFEVVTKPYTEDSPSLLKLWRDATVEYSNRGGANVTVTPGYKLDSAQLPAGGVFFYLPRQDVYTITAATNATPIVVTCGAHDIKQDSWVNVSGVTGNLNANGKFRVQAVTATTVTLMGSYGSGAYVSGGTIQNVEARDFSLIEVEEGMGTAVEYRINDTDSGGAGGADSFELYGIMHTYEARDPNVE